MLRPPPSHICNALLSRTLYLFEDAKTTNSWLILLEQPNATVYALKLFKFQYIFINIYVIRCFVNRQIEEIFLSVLILLSENIQESISSFHRLNPTIFNTHAFNDLLNFTNDYHWFVAFLLFQRKLEIFSNNNRIVTPTPPKTQRRTSLVPSIPADALQKSTEHLESTSSPPRVKQYAAFSKQSKKNLKRLTR